MPSQSSPAAVKEENRLRALLAQDGVKFHIKTSGAKWRCTILDRNTHEKRQEALRTTSSSSTDSDASSSVSK
ncbi:hypothetical protein B0H67DRAFT_645406 [Lasiosphaeris hirsuta]|uniref:Uncharacterized protein n=1 Tax=Lasiosphaeris hirsuta TaxID=260670 RepID=A0AA40AH02_9PEZI|nr:hypothetical protein B0H67DRAFT_645406 [Lasiosphaeris hirsuta]